MALKARVVTGQLTSGVSSGTINITSADLTDVDFGWIFCCGASAVETLADHGAYSIGYFCRSGSSVDTQGTISGFVEHNVGTSDTERKMDDSRVIEMIDTGGVEGELEATSFVTGGIQGTYRSAFTGAYRFFAVLVETDKTYKGTVDADLNTALTTYTWPGFKPDGITIWGTTGGTTFGTVAKGFFGAALRNAADDSSDECCVGWEFSDSSSSSESVAGSSDTRIGLRLSGSNNYYASYYLEDFAATGYEANGAGSGGNMSGSKGLAWQMPTGQELLCGREDGPIATGTKNVTTNYSAGDDDSELFLVFGCETNDSDTTAPSWTDGIFFGACDSQGNEACIAVLNESGAGTSVAKSYFSDAATFAMHQDAATLIKKGSITNLTGGNATFNFSTCDTNTWGYSWLAMQAGASSPDLALTGTMAGAAAWSAAASANYPMAGTMGGVALLSGQLIPDYPLAASIPGASVWAGALVHEGPSLDLALSGAMAGASMLSGQLAADYPMAGTIAGVSSLSGQIFPDYPLAASIPGASAWAGALVHEGPSLDLALSGAMVGASMLSGQLIPDYPLAASIAGASAFSGNVVFTPGGDILPLAGAFIGGSSVSGVLAADSPLGGSVAGLSQWSAVLAADFPMSSSWSGIATLSGQLSLPGLGEWVNVPSVSDVSEVLAVADQSLRNTVKEYSP